MAGYRPWSLMAFLVTPSTVAPAGSLTASGTGTRKRPTRIRVASTDPVMPNAILAEFTMAASGKFSRMITAPGGPDRETGLVLQQKRSDGVWAQTASVKVLLVAGGGGGTPVPPPNIPPDDDVTAPIVSGVSATVTTTTAVINATTDEAATVIVEYNTTGVWPGTMTAATTSGTSHSRTLSGLTPGQTYTYRIRATDTAGNLKLDNNRTFTTTSSPTLPGAPTGLTATGGNTSVALAWVAPTSNGGSAITGYRVYRNGASLIVLGVVTSYNNTGLTNGLQYSYMVAAITAVGEGPQSASASATPATAGDTTPPTVSNVVVSGITTTSVTITWTTNEAATGIVEYGTTTGYGTQTAATGSGTNHSRTLSGLTPGQVYQYRIRATDTAGNLRLDSNRTFTTTAASTLPGAPTGLVATGGNAQVVLIWTAPSNNGGSAITSYRIFRNGSSLTTDPASPYTDSTVTNGIQYSYTVAAITAVGEGPQSNTATATPAAAGDINPPTVSNVAVSAITTTGATITCNTNEASTVIVEYGLSTSYGSQTAATSSGTSHSRNLTGLLPNTLNHFRIRATDTAGNLRLDSDRTFTTLASPPPGGQTPSSPIEVTTDNVTIENKSFTAPTNSGYAIYAHGTYSNTVANLIIRNCTFSGFRTAISLEHVSNILIEDCVIQDAQYAGILGYSIIGGVIQRNTIRRIGMTIVGNNNAYGIALSRNAVASFVTDPRSSDVDVLTNVIEDVPLWHALDTHAGERINFEGNTVRRTPRAVFLTGDGIGSRGLSNTAHNNQLLEAVQIAGGTNKSGVTLSDQTSPTVTNNAISSTYVTAINTPSDHPSSGTITISGNTTVP